MKKGCHVVVMVYLAFLITACSGGGSGSSTSANDSLATPTGVTVDVASGSNEATVSWTPVDGADSYSILWATGAQLDVATANRIDNLTGTFYQHTGLQDNTTYSYAVLAVGASAESAASTSSSVTITPPVVSGTTSLPALDTSYVNSLPGGGVDMICVYTMSFEQLECNQQLDGNNQVIYTDERSYSFTVARDASYIMGVSYGGGIGFSALTGTVTKDATVELNLDNEVAMNLISVVEGVHNPSFVVNDFSTVSDSIDVILPKANQAVANLNAFYQDRNLNRQADRVTEAVRNFTLDRFNLSSGILVTELKDYTIRAYGGGLDGVRTLDEMVSAPKPPLNPYITFTRGVDTGSGTVEHSIAMTDLDNIRWDYIASNATTASIAVGSNQVVYAASTLSIVNSGGWSIRGIYIKGLDGTGEQRLTPDTLHVISPAMSPDGTKVVFGGKYVSLSDTISPEEVSKPYNIFTINTDGSALQQHTFDTFYPVDKTKDPWGIYGSSYFTWKPDGNSVVYMKYAYDAADPTNPSKNFSNIMTLDLTLQPAVETTHISYANSGIVLASMPTWMPDGGAILFTGYSDGTGLFTMDSYFELYQYDPVNYTLWRYPSGGHSRMGATVAYDGRSIVYTTSSTDGLSLKAMSRYSGELLHDMGDFANADNYTFARFTGTEAAYQAVDGTTTDAQGTVIVDPATDQRTTTSSSGTTNTYYRTIIPAANSAGIDFNVTAW